ncbi:hypothetical protein, partial [Mesotoga sp. UBA5825]|uniref:hypothetical protein n=1 Tax=Mesotoga sp. UBA5825 TaxID=1946858 RepID=UPI0025CCB0AE
AVVAALTGAGQVCRWNQLEIDGPSARIVTRWPMMCSGIWWPRQVPARGWDMQCSTIADEER